MSSYIGRYADLYDIFYADKPYTEEAVFIHLCLQQYGVGETHRLLELACGTGTHALALEKMGYKIVAIDCSEDMLACARAKASQVSSSIDFRRQDMRKLDISGEPFDAVICLFDSMGFVKTNEAIKKAFRGVYHNLRPDGLFVFEFWHAAAMLRSYDPVRIRRWSISEGELVRISETELDCSKQLAKVIYTIYSLNNDGTYTSLRETQTNRYFLIQEMASLLSSCGLTPLKWFAGYALDENITEKTWHIVAVARKEKKYQ